MQYHVTYDSNGEDGFIIPKPDGEVLMTEGFTLPLMDQGLIHNPNVSPTSYAMKLWGLFDKVAHIAHITQQNFVIGQFAKMQFFHWSRCPW